MSASSSNATVSYDDTLLPKDGWIESVAKVIRAIDDVILRVTKHKNDGRDLREMKPTVENVCTAISTVDYNKVEPRIADTASSEVKRSALDAWRCRVDKYEKKKEDLKVFVASVGFPERSFETSMAQRDDRQYQFLY